MPARLPSKPGWYRDPDNPRLLRHWDGTTWGERPRTAPQWYRASELFLADERGDRSTEGPSHPNELKERVASVGAWSRDWLPWRPRQLESGWPRPGTGYDPGQIGQARPQSASGLGPARRPLLAMVCLLVVAVAVVISSVAFITPYEVRRALPSTQSALISRFNSATERQCNAYLPAERASFANGALPQSLAASATKVEQLQARLSKTAEVSPDSGHFNEWLAALSNLASDQRRYASALSPPATVRPFGIAGSISAPSQDVQTLRSRTLSDATLADKLSGDMALGDACRLGLGNGS